MQAFFQKVTFGLLMDLKQNHYSICKTYKVTIFKIFLYLIIYKNTQLLFSLALIMYYFYVANINEQNFGGLHKNKNCVFPSRVIVLIKESLIFWKKIPQKTKLF